MKIDSNEANDSVFLLLCFYLMVQESLVEAEIGR